MRVSDPQKSHSPREAGNILLSGAHLTFYSKDAPVYPPAIELSALHDNQPVHFRTECSSSQHQAHITQAFQRLCHG